MANKKLIQVEEWKHSEIFKKDVQPTFVHPVHASQIVHTSLDAAAGST